MYMMPIFLWSMLVIQSRHSGPHSLNLVSRPSTTRPPSTTPAKVAIRIGSCSGIAAQLSLPSRGETVAWAEEGSCMAIPDSGDVRIRGRSGRG